LKIPLRRICLRHDWQNAEVSGQATCYKTLWYVVASRSFVGDWIPWSACIATVASTRAIS